MTQDELDLLASAYLDGEATPDEVALVERDPQLRAMVAELRAVDLGLGVPSTAPTPLIEAHLAAARQAFEQEMTVRRESSKALAAASASRPTTDDGGGARSATPWWRSMPSWLPVAAGLLIVGGGLLATLGQINNDESGDETAEVAVAAADDSSDTAESDQAATFDSNRDADATETEAFDAASSEMADSATDDADIADSLSQDSEESAEVAAADLVGPIIFDEVPTSLDGVVLPELNDPLDSPCFEIVSEEPVVIDGFVEAFLGQEPVELWIIERSIDFERRPLLVDADCLILGP